MNQKETIKIAILKLHEALDEIETTETCVKQAIEILRGFDLRHTQTVDAARLALGALAHGNGSKQSVDQAIRELTNAVNKFDGQQ